MRWAERLEGIAEFQGKYALLSTWVVESRIRQIQDLLASGSLHVASRGGRLCKVDISELSAEAVRSLLLSFHDGNPTVLLTWPADRDGIAMSYTDFVKHYDDLWFPSRDDLWITDDTRDWLIEIDHEEELTLFLTSSRKEPEG